MHYRKLWLTIGIVYIGFILAASLLKAPDVNVIISHTDKAVHFLSYFILVGWFVQLYPKLSSRISILISAIALGMLIEYLQGMISYRSFDFADEVANSIGALSAFILARTPFDSLLATFDHWFYQLKTN
ncbi:MAG: VanZ family protein [gamma proteobacterium symbiont of Lucinoma myriamae]|nr:VanZ family protein [gamma proteobacterium symbiont of Lucinoma myriamae]MCU7800429.1 VanZ family protein [gamma proteobacterium symbiont of Lucinoma myriamae]MCU7818203.1 VanZ family protein [gamma proteobacterium symbiont of Lucinoma myriamae]MCU7831544.1 VanZ family protein [gamma proteobacterium symbiont of Lucinoma myriamae]